MICLFTLNNTSFKTHQFGLEEKMASSLIVASVTFSKKGKHIVHSSLKLLPVLCMSWHMTRVWWWWWGGILS